MARFIVFTLNRITHLFQKHPFSMFSGDREKVYWEKWVKRLVIMQLENLLRLQNQPGNNITDNIYFY